jgi:hypothetical protein
MLTENGSGKYLNRDWRRKRAQAMVDRDRFSDSELEWLEIAENDGTGKLRKETYEIETQPVVDLPYAATSRRRHDVRERPECGGID